jgi:selenocysteine lyase/cysteine desulfurase
MLQKAMQAWGSHKNIVIHGPLDLPRLAIISFSICLAGKVLHHNFVVALLNDLFGIQARGGCACAGPFGQALLGIDFKLVCDPTRCWHVPPPAPLTADICSCCSVYQIGQRY